MSICTEEAKALNWHYLPTSGSGEIPARSSFGNSQELTSVVPHNWRAEPSPLVVLGSESQPKNSLIDWYRNTTSILSAVLVRNAVMTIDCSALHEEDYFQAWRSAKQKVSLVAKPYAGVIAATQIAHYVEKLEADLRLTKSQLARALLVERATLYQWLRGAQPRARTIERLEQLRQFATEWKEAGLSSARAGWHFRVPGAAHTLGFLLTQDPMNFEELRRHIRHTRQAPETMELVEPKASFGFSSPNESAERKRDRETFPPTFSNNE